MSEHEVTQRLLNALRAPLGAESAIDVALWLAYLRGLYSDDWQSRAREIARGDEPRSKAPDQRGVRGPSVEIEPKALEGAVGLLDGMNVERCAELFEECLVMRESQLARFARSSSSMKWLGELQVDLLASSSQEVFDPVCGFGGTLLAAARAGAERVVGVDVNGQAINVARMRFALHGVQAELHTADVLESEPRSFDAVVADPPMGGVPGREVKARWGVKGGVDSAGVWLRVIQRSLADDGRGVVLVPASALRRSTTFAELAETGHIESVIILPSRAYAGLRIPVALLVMTAAVSQTAEIPVIDAQSFLKHAPRQGLGLPQSERDQLVRILRLWHDTQTLDAPAHVATLFPRSAAQQGFEVVFAEPPTEELVLPPVEHRLIQALRVEGLKSFSEMTEVPMAPITLIYGPNSVGKSTAIQALMVFLQSSRSSSLITEGQHARLGSFATAVSGHDPDRSVRIGLDFGIVPPWGKTTALSPSLLRSIDVEYRSADGLTAELVRTRIRIDGEASLTALAASASSAGDREVSHEVKDCWDCDKEALVGFSELLDDRAHTFFDPEAAVVGEDRSTRSATGFMRLRAAAQQTSRSPQSKVLAELRGPVPWGVAVQGPRRFEMMDLVGLWERELNLALGLLQDEIQRMGDRLVKLGPVRPAPTRIGLRRAGGLEASDDYASFLFDNPSAVESLNTWLDRLDIGYRLSILPLGQDPRLAAAGDHLLVLLEDKRTGVEVTPADVGYGVSQVLPILVQCLRSTEQVLCIEQPELHLHPRLQAKLADLFIESSAETGGGNQLLVETHSEHLLLRLQRRIREGRVDPKDVAVLYVDHDGESATVKRLRLGSNGEMLDPWPEGFFDESLDDLLGGWE